MTVQAAVGDNDDPNSKAIVVGTEFSDDAAIVRLPGDTERALVLTADVIGPLVDDPETFGAIAAANALSDVYAMGGRPLYALNLAFFPDELLSLDVLQAVMRGASRTCAEAGVSIVGGHTVRDDDIKFGLSVTGEVALGSELSNRGAVAGQHLVLTKSLGTGIVAGAIKAGTAESSVTEATIASMLRLNDAALTVGRRHGATACTDVTGFGLLGHLRNILMGSELTATLHVDSFPILPGALELAYADKVPEGTRANLKFVESTLDSGTDVDPAKMLIAADAQTSGGLLLCLAADVTKDALAELSAEGHNASIVGVLESPTEDKLAGRISLRP